MQFMNKSLMAAVGLAVLIGTGPAQAEVVRTQLGGTTLNANLEKTGAFPGGPVILITHGTLAHRGMEITAGLQRMFKEREVSTLAINLSLGVNDREAAMYDCPTPHDHKHTDAVDEIGAWVGWLKEQGVESMVLLGHSRGGNQTARYAAAHGDAPFSKVVLLAPATWTEGKDAKGYKSRYGADLAPILAEAQAKVAAGKGAEMMDLKGFIYCENTKASARAVASYYANDPDMDSPTVIPRIKTPVLVVAGSADTVVADLPEKMEPIADGEKVMLEVLDGADHFFRDLYSEDIADIVTDWVAAE